jgi:hypothetical protein
MLKIKLNIVYSISMISSSRSISRIFTDASLSEYFVIFETRIKWNSCFRINFDRWKNISIRIESSTTTSNYLFRNTSSTSTARLLTDSSSNNQSWFFSSARSSTRNEFQTIKEIIWLRNLLVQLTINHNYLQTIKRLLFWSRILNFTSKQSTSTFKLISFAKKWLRMRFNFNMFSQIKWQSMI